MPTQALPLLVVLGERQNETAAALVLVPVPMRALPLLVPLSAPLPPTPPRGVDPLPSIHHD